MNNPTHIRKEQKVIAWQWTGDNEETCPWELIHEEDWYVSVKGEWIEEGWWVVGELGNESIEVFDSESFSNLFTPIPTCTEPLTIEYKPLLAVKGSKKNYNALYYDERKKTFCHSLFGNSCVYCYRIYADKALKEASAARPDLDFEVVAVYPNGDGWTEDNPYQPSENHAPQRKGV